MNLTQLIQKRYSGIQNPSGGVALNVHTFAVADDEQNQLCIYDRSITRYPIQKISLSALFPGYVQDGEHAELDLEGGTNLQGTFFWIGSHSNSRKGEQRPARHRLLALNIEAEDNGRYSVEPVGHPYTQLLQDLLADSRFAPFELQKAIRLAPKEFGGLSIEGLAATPEGTLLIGFRNPLHGGRFSRDQYRYGKALVVELLNPMAVIKGASAQFADPISLDLDGYGVRDIVWHDSQKYLIIAGPYDPGISSELFWWSRKNGNVKRVASFKSYALNLETAIVYPGGEAVQLLSDDGTLKNAKGFRSIQIAI